MFDADSSLMMRDVLPALARLLCDSTLLANFKELHLPWPAQNVIVVVLLNASASIPSKVAYLGSRPHFGPLRSPYVRRKSKLSLNADHSPMERNHSSAGITAEACRHQMDVLG